MSLDIGAEAATHHSDSDADSDPNRMLSPLGLEAQKRKAVAAARESLDRIYKVARNHGQGGPPGAGGQLLALKRVSGVSSESIMHCWSMVWALVEYYVVGRLL